MDVESFPDRTYVSLWIREYEAYLYATADGEDVRLSANVDGCLHAAWAVHRLVRGDTDYVLFQSASYGRYLAINLAQADDGDEAGDVYYLPGQSTYDSPEQENVLFQAVRAEEEEDDDDIYLRHVTFGDWCRPDDEDTALPGPWPLHWVVEAIPPRPFPPALPDPTPVYPPAEVRLRVRIGRRGGNFAADAVQTQPVLRRRINYWCADDQGNFNPLHRRVLAQFEGQYVFNLRRDIAAALGEADNAITLCVSGGSIGRLTPLVIDLPPDEKTMNIIVLTTGSPAAQALVYPNVDAL